MIGQITGPAEMKIVWDDDEFRSRDAVCTFKKYISFPYDFLTSEHEAFVVKFYFSNDWLFCTDFKTKYNWLESRLLTQSSCKTELSPPASLMENHRIYHMRCVFMEL